MYNRRMEPLTAVEAAKRIKFSVRRVQQLVKAGRLPAKMFGGALMIQEKDLKLVANRKAGRPPSKLGLWGERPPQSERDYLTCVISASVTTYKQLKDTSSCKIETWRNDDGTY